MRHDCLLHADGASLAISKAFRISTIGISSSLKLRTLNLELQNFLKSDSAYWKYSSLVILIWEVGVIRFEILEFSCSKELIT